MSGSVAVRTEHDGAVLRVVLGPPPANIVDGACIEALRTVLKELPAEGPLRLVVIEGEGKHFSFGASVEEHLPREVATMLPGFHGLLRELLEVPAPTLALIRGCCLGGGLELAMCCDVLLAQEGAKLGQPEIVLGVFAPAASAMLPLRIGHAAATDLLLTGRNVRAERAQELGLVAGVGSDGEELLQTWIERNVLPRSAVALRLAARACRGHLSERFNARLSEVEELYLSTLVPTDDATEGIQSFLEKRPPVWKHA